MIEALPSNDQAKSAGTVAIADHSGNTIADLESGNGSASLLVIQSFINKSMRSSSQLSFGQKVRKLWSFMGPTFLISCTLLDPGAIEGSLVQGAYTGYQLLWVTFWSTMMVFTIQTQAARLGIATGKSLSSLLRHEYMNAALARYIIWIGVEVSVVGDDLQALVGATTALQLLFGIPFWSGVLIMSAATIALCALYNHSPTRTEAAVGVMLTSMLVIYIVNLGYSAPPASSVFFGLIVPTSSSYATIALVGSIGGILTPSTLFLGSHLVLTRPVNRDSNSSSNDIDESCNYSTVELGIGVCMSFLANFFVVLCFANAFYSSSCATAGFATVQGVCSDIALSDAPDALQQLYGSAAKYMFGVALLFSGLNSTISATLAGQVTFEGFSQLKITFAQRLMLTRVLTIGPTLALALCEGGDQTAFSEINEWINIMMAMVMPLAMIPLFHMSTSTRVMGHRTFAAATTTAVVLWCIVLMLISINFYLLIGFIFQPEQFGSQGSFPDQPFFYAIMGVIIAIYVYLLINVAWPALTDGVSMITDAYTRVMAARQGYDNNNNNNNSSDSEQENSGEKKTWMQSLMLIGNYRLAEPTSNGTDIIRRSDSGSSINSSNSSKRYSSDSHNNNSTIVDLKTIEQQPRKSSYGESNNSSDSCNHNSHDNNSSSNSSSSDINSQHVIPHEYSISDSNVDVMSADRQSNPMQQI